MNDADTIISEHRRFFDKVDALGDCWEWTGYRKSDGYGRFSPAQHKSTLAHRHAYETLIGPIPPGLVLDHLCRNHGCVNPDHLEPVTQAENLRRGYGPGWRAYRSGYCLRGHALTGENVGTQGPGWRYCKTCRAEGIRRRRAA